MYSTNTTLMIRQERGNRWEVIYYEKIILKNNIYHETILSRYNPLMH